MRILMLVPQVFYSPRGTPLSAYHRAIDLTTLGHDVDVLTYALGDPPPDFPGRVFRARGPHLARSIRQGPSYLKVWFDALILLSLVVRLARGRYEAVYAHEEGGFLAALVAPLFGLPLVYEMHSSLPLQIRAWSFSEREWVVRLFRWVERFTLRRARVAVAISPGVAEAAQRALPQVEVITILNRFALDDEATEEDGQRLRRELGLAPEHRVVLYTGSFVPLQALDLLIASIPLVIRAVPSAKFVLVGGRGPEIDGLHRIARDAGVDAALLLLTARPQSEMSTFMAASDALASPRIQGINPPGKLFSYLSSGKPVVATDCPVHSQILNPGCAILTTPDPYGFAEGVVAALMDETRRARVLEGAREILRTEYGPERRAAAYCQLVARLESARASRPWWRLERAVG